MSSYHLHKCRIESCLRVCDREIVTEGYRNFKRPFSRILNVSDDSRAVNMSARPLNIHRFHKIADGFPTQSVFFSRHSCVCTLGGRAPPPACPNPVRFLLLKPPAADPPARPVRAGAAARPAQDGSGCAGSRRAPQWWR